MKSNKLAPKKKNVAQAMVEFAIVLPILLLLLYGLLEVGRLLFMYSTVVTASRQAVRYGSATGIGTGSLARYRDCTGIREAANKADYLRAFDHTTNDVQIWWEAAPNDGNLHTICAPGVADGNWTPSGNSNRLVVRVTGHFQPLVRLVPFGARTIESRSHRTILMSISIAVTSPPGAPTSAATSAGTPLPTSTPTVTPIGYTPPPTTVGITPLPTQVPGNTPVPTNPPQGNPNLKVQLKIEGTDNNQQTGFRFRVQNIGAGPGSNISVRIYFTLDGANLASNYVLEKYYDQTNAAIVSGPTQLAGKMYYFTVNYGGAALPAGGAWEYQGALRLSSWASTYDGTNDWWHTTAALPASFTDWPTLPAYIGSPLVWGGEPGSAPVPECNQIAKDVKKTALPLKIINGQVTAYIDIPNAYAYPIRVNTIYLKWNYNNGHNSPFDQTVRLQKAAFGSVSGTPTPITIWIGDQPGASYTITASNPAFVLAPGETTRLTFTFHQSYDISSKEELEITFSTPGCENDKISVKY